MITYNKNKSTTKTKNLNILFVVFFLMKEYKEKEYDRLEAPYETIDETRREIFETIDWQQAVAQLFDIFSNLRKGNNKIVNVSVDWELEQAIFVFSKTMTNSFSEDYQNETSEALLQKMKYFKTEFLNREIDKLDLSTIDGFSKLLDIYTTIEKQCWMRAKLHAKLMMWLTEEELDEIENENLLLEWFLEKEKENEKVNQAYAQELNEIFSSTWGVDFRIWKSRESLINIGITDPTDKDIMEIAERAFNWYVKDIFWIDLPPLHFVNRQEELLKAELWFSKLYAYILKNQLPN